MLRSRSYNAAVRSSSGYVHRQPNPYALSNKFISVNQSSRDASARPDTTLKDKSWPADLTKLAVKDNITTSQLPTTCGSYILKTYTSPFEATVIEKLRSLGASVKGKTNLDEFGMGSHSINSYFGPVSDESEPRRSVGGSSGGSAIAVAKRLSQFALGTDTGGSVRLPAAYTGVVGFKPSYGLISRWGVVPYANSLDTVGILAPSAIHLPTILATLRHHDPRDPTSVTDHAWSRICQKPTGATKTCSAQAVGLDFTKITIGVPVEYNIEELEPEIRQAWATTLSLLREKGCKIAPVSLPNTKHALSAYYVLAPAEAASNLAKYDGVRYGSRNSTGDGAGDVLYSETRGKGFGEEVKRRILLGSYTLSATAIDNYFLQAQRVRRLVQRDFNRVFLTPNPLHPEEQFDISDLHESIPLEDKLGPTQVDFLVCPTAPTLPPTLRDAFNQSSVDGYMNDVFTVPASLAGLPAISLPCPIPKIFETNERSHIAGIQIIGQYGSDYKVLEVSKELENILQVQQDFQDPLDDKNYIDKKKQTKKRERRPETQAKTVNASKQASSQKFQKRPEAKVFQNSSISESVEKSDLRIVKYFTTDHVRVKKFESKRGDYHRLNLTNQEADSMLSDAFDGWSPEGYSNK